MSLRYPIPKSKAGLTETRAENQELVTRHPWRREEGLEDSRDAGMARKCGKNQSRDCETPTEGRCSEGLAGGGGLNLNQGDQ